MQQTDGIDSAQDDENIEQPEKTKTQRCTIRDVRPGRHERNDHGINGFPADPCLNAEPATRNQRTEHRRNIRSEHAEGSSSKNGERNPVLRSGVGVEKHRNQHQHVAEEDREQGLFPVHAAGNHAAG